MLEDFAPDDWLTRRDYPDLPPDAERHMRVAALAWDRKDEAEAHLDAARALAPNHLQVHVSRYKFFFYSHQYPKAIDAVQTCLGLAGADLGLSGTPEAHTPADADFTALVPQIRFYLSATLALAWCLMRHGRQDEGRALMEHLATLDTAGQTAVHPLLTAMDAADPLDET